MTDEANEILTPASLSRIAEKAAETAIDGLGAFFSTICMPAAEEYGLLLRDKITFYRLKNLVKIAEKTKQLIKHQKILPTGDANPHVLKEIIEESSWSSDDQLQNMWAGLIAGSASSTSESDDTLVYIETLKKLSPFQARIVEIVYRDPRCCSVPNAGQAQEFNEFYPDNELVYTTPYILKRYPGDLSQFVPIANVTAEELIEDSKHHSIAISRFRPQLEALVSMGIFNRVTINSDNPITLEFTPTMQGLDFQMRCMGYKMYPLEAWLLTLQHWCKQRGIDPFTYDLMIG